MKPGKGVPTKNMIATITIPFPSAPICVICGLLILLACLARARAAQVTLTWDLNPDTNVIGSFLYYGRPGVYTNRIDCGPTNTVTVTGLATNTPYAFATAAYTASGTESDFSPALTLTLPLTLPRSNAPTVMITTYLDATTNGIAWGALTQWTVLLPATNALQYFRPRSSIIQTN